MRYNIVQQLKWDHTPVDGKSGVVQFAPAASIADYPEIDLFGYMKTTKGGDAKGGAMTRSAVARLSNADFPGAISERSGVSDEHGTGEEE